MEHAPPGPRVAGRWPAADAILRYLATLACAGSAGVHAALVGPHLREGGPLLAAAFATAALVLTAMALAVRRPQHDAWAPGLASAVLAVVAAAYLLVSRTSGLPLLIEQPEHPDPLGAATVAAELAGALAAAFLMSRKDR